MNGHPSYNARSGTKRGERIITAFNKKVGVTVEKGEVIF